MKKIIDFIIEKRYIIALFFLTLFTVFGITGSSIGAITRWILEPEKANNIIGTYRFIRSDEYAVETPLMIAQKTSELNHFTNLNGITKTDMNMSIHTPTKTLVTLFRIYNIGYLFLNSRMAFSFAWNIKVIALLLITYELMRLITKDEKYLSFLATILICCSSFINWWMSIDILVFGELLIIALDRFMLYNNNKLKVFWLLVFTYSAISYIMTLYPAWIVSFGYIFLSLAIWVVIKNRKEYKLKKIDIACFIGIILAICLFAIYFYNSSYDAIQSIIHSSYPGEREEKGGNGIKYLFSYLYSFMLPFAQNVDTMEYASFLSFFPVPIIMALIYLYKKENHIEFLLPMLIVLVLETVWCISGLPNIFAKITLFSIVPVERCAVSVGLGLIYLLFYMFAHVEERFVKQSHAVYIILVILALLVFIPFPFGLDMKRNLYVFAIIETLGGFLLLNIGDIKYQKLFLFFTVIVTLLSGLTINPITVGIKPMNDTDFAKFVQKEVRKNPNMVWITENMDMVVSNYLVAQGAKTLNVTQTYPNEEFWNRILENRAEEYKKIWNRYAHIKIALVEENIKPYIELLSNDRIKLYITPTKLKDLNVNYIVSYKNLEDIWLNGLSIKKIYAKEIKEETIIDGESVLGIYIYEFVN